MDGNLLSGLLPESLGRLTQLGKSDCRTNAPFDACLTSSPSRLSWPLLREEELYLFDNQLQNFLPTSLGDLTSLKDFRAQHNLLSGPIPTELAHLSMLQTLFLNNNTFGGAIPDALARLVELRSLQLHGNRFLGLMPPALCVSMSQLTELSSDCAGDDPEVQCDCCTSCYKK
jgi:Leucine-rich repeat (LRR) protein